MSSYEYHLAQDDLVDPVADVVHGSDPCHLIATFEFFGNAFLFGKLLHQLETYLICLLVNTLQIGDIIWSNDIDYDDWREDLEEQYPDLSEAERMELMYELNGDYLDDERSNLDIQLSRPILVVGDLGLWHGRRMGYKEIPSGNIRDCLYSERDMDHSTWYVDKNGDFRCDAIHHDGTNHYLYRAYKDGVSDTQIDNLKEKLYWGTATRADITRVTRRLGDEIAHVYGFPIPRRQAPVQER